MRTVKCVVVTGTPGCGKTRIAKALAKELGWTYVDGKHIVAALPSRYDSTRRCRVIDEDTFAREARRRVLDLGGRAVIDSHLSHFIDPLICRTCIVVTCPRDVLFDRLRQRGYPKAKIEENMQCEIMEVCKAEALEHGHCVIEVCGAGMPDLFALKRELRVGSLTARPRKGGKRREETKKEKKRKKD